MGPASKVQQVDLYDLNLTGLEALLAGWGYTPFYAERLWRAVYGRQVRSFSEIVDLPADLNHELARAAYLGGLSTEFVMDSDDGFTRKFLLGLEDGETIETVLMKFKGRATACVSTQVGCAMGCIFCATGQMGFKRHLRAGEIVAQVLHVISELQERGEELRNIVLMGMGEPLHNYDATMAAVDILMDHKGMAMAPKHITLSTVGVVPGIKRMADEARPIRLAVSLHAATDAEREALVPPARRWPLGELIDACRYYIAKRQRRIFFEWTLIEGKNDTPEQAYTLGSLLQGLAAHVNLIPLNPTPGYEGRPAQTKTARQFQAILRQHGLPSTVRQRRGIDIAAGCGQLRTGIDRLSA